MKQTASAAPGLPGETAQPVGTTRLRYPGVRPEKKRTNLSKLMPFFLVTLVVALLMTAFMKLNSKPATALSPVHTKLVGNAAGHDITAEIDAAGYLFDRPDGTSVEFFKYALVIEKERILLDGKERARIPAAAIIKIVVAHNELRVTANGKNALRTTIRRQG